MVQFFLAQVLFALANGADPGAAVTDAAIDKTWQQYLDTPPPKAVQLAAELAARADLVAKSLSTVDNVTISGEFDVVCSGGGDLNAYYMGIEMVLRRAGLKEQRHAGTSAGGWMSFEIPLKGEARTLQSYLSYGELQEANPIHFSTVATTVLLQDHHWQMMARWQATKWNSTLSSLDGKVFLGLSCKKHPFSASELVVISEFTSPEQAAAAFEATGACTDTDVEGMQCVDGSSASGSKMTPLFQDGRRPQLIIDLMETGFPTVEMGLGKFTSSQYFNLVKRGQDEASEFLKIGKVARSAGAITWCPVGSNVKQNVCKKV